METYSVTSTKYRHKTCWVTIGIIAVCIVLLPWGDFLPLVPAFISYAFTGHVEAEQLLALSMFVAYMFQHSGFWHLVSNLFFLVLLGPVFEDAVGHWRFLVFMLLAGIGAGLVHFAANPLLSIPLVGLSGAIFAALVALTLASPWCALFEFSVGSVNIALRLYQLVLLMLAVQVYDVVFGPGVSHGDANAHLVHLGGALSGLLMWAVWLKNVFADYRRNAGADSWL